MTDALSLESLYVGAHPVVQPILERLRVRAFLEETLGKPDPRTKLSLVRVPRDREHSFRSNVNTHSARS